MRILLVDDDIELADMLGSYLERESCLVQKVSDGTSAVVQALSGQFDLMVLDVMMPGLSGVEVLRRVREHSMLPVLMLTARGDDTDRVLGLELGADDYVPKPCTPRELLARIRAILRRTGNQVQPAQENDVLREGPLTMWPGERRAQWADETLELTSTEYSLLELLVRHAGQPVGKDVLSKQALGRPLARFDRSVDVHMSSIRQKLSRVAPGRICIQTVVRRGYQFIKA
ncbi:MULTISPECIES: response regulator transcription factor [Aquitalea]|jgi:two-component system, OmpR family, response regulator|uniref:DNA-binding response regulator n=2 Tax=Aquitalea TaxID=407217 RepID=A0A454JFP8_9NEIS|nr:MULTISPECIES: response regulator transcription factor [Aquitalea]MBA4707016.1 response regulator transcription factor [Aquitalea magnusonii]RMC94635.1 DNA-binding response regulator [Aquitalea palustris]